MSHDCDPEEVIAKSITRMRQLRFFSNPNVVKDDGIEIREIRPMGNEYADNAQTIRDNMVRSKEIIPSSTIDWGTANDSDICTPCSYGAATDNQDGPRS